MSSRSVSNAHDRAGGLDTVPVSARASRPGRWEPASKSDPAECSGIGAAGTPARSNATRSTRARLQWTSTATCDCGHREGDQNADLRIGCTCDGKWDRPRKYEDGRPPILGLNLSLPLLIRGFDGGDENETHGAPAPLQVGVAHEAGPGQEGLDVRVIRVLDGPQLHGTDQ